MGPALPGLAIQLIGGRTKESGVSGFPEAAERALSLAFDLIFAPSFCKRAVGRHEPCQHRRDQFQGVGDRLPGFACKCFGVSKQIAMHACGKFDGQFHRPVVSYGTELKLCHESALTSVRLEHEVAVDDHAHRKSRPDRQCRLDVEILLNDLLSSLVQAIAGSTAER